MRKIVSFCGSSVDWVSFLEVVARKMFELVTACGGMVGRSSFFRKFESIFHKIFKLVSAYGRVLNLVLFRKYFDLVALRKNKIVSAGGGMLYLE